MKNPWEEIELSDYENHMSLDSVKQLQAMNHMMKDQFNRYEIESVMVFGVAGGNGLEHADTSRLTKIYGVDINAGYLNEVRKRYPNLNGFLECLCVDLAKEPEKLPHTDMIIANLLIEYIGYDCFQKAVKTVNPQYVSCIIQINVDDSFVSDSPYLHVFDGLESVHHQMAEEPLQKSMEKIGYHLILTVEQPLPNGKKLIRMDYCHEI